MANILAFGSSVQATSFAMLTTAYDIFTPEGVRQSTPTSATVITTPPTFAGITAVTPTVDGAINVAWGSFTSVNLPVVFQIYVALGSVSAATLFALQPVAIAPNTASNWYVTQLSDQSTYLIKGQVYTFGVRCRDGVNNQNTNLTIMTATAIGSANLVTVLQTLAINLAATEVLLTQDHTDFQNDHIDFQGDHANFVTDNTNFQNTNNDLAATHVDLQADHADFGTDHANFQSDHADLAGDHTDLVAVEVALSATEVAIEADADRIEAAANLLLSTVL